jgi:hypothetical protein
MQGLQEYVSNVWTKEVVHTTASRYKWSATHERLYMRRTVPGFLKKDPLVGSALDAAKLKFESFGFGATPTLY